LREAAIERKISKMLLKVLLALFLVFQSQGDILEFQVCPESHPIAFHFGQKCCSHLDVVVDATWPSNKCDGEAISCPALSCEDQKSSCNPNLFVASSSGGEVYSMIEYLEGNRPIYINDKKETCIWWNKENRHWWWGPCENVGTSSGNAYLQEDNSCPLGLVATWRSSGSDEVIKDLTVNGLFAQAVAGQVVVSSGTAAVNVIVREGTYQQSCRFKFHNGKYKCVNE
jgi:hypothetical protein